MKKLILVVALVALFSFDVNAQVYQYQTVTVIESIIPNGLGRSRMIQQTTPEIIKMQPQQKLEKRIKETKQIAEKFV